jgi:hypothetical protein
MHTASHIVREFFERYERSRSTIDASLIDEQYPDAFTFAGPAGARIAESRRSWPVCQRVYCGWRIGASPMSAERTASTPTSDSSSSG